MVSNAIFSYATYRRYLLGSYLGIVTCNFDLYAQDYDLFNLKWSTLGRKKVIIHKLGLIMTLLSTFVLWSLLIYCHPSQRAICPPCAIVVHLFCWKEVHPSSIHKYLLALPLCHLRFVRIAVSSGVISLYPIPWFLYKKAADVCSWRC